MFCKHCGARIDDDAAFCPACGGALEGRKVSAQAAAPASAAPAPSTADSPVTLMVLGIIALATCGFGLPGLIIGSIDKKKVRRYLNAGLPVTAMVRLGSIFSKIAFIVGIVMTVFWTVYITVAGILIALAVYGGLSLSLGGLL